MRLVGTTIWKALGLLIALSLWSVACTTTPETVSRKPYRVSMPETGQIYPLQFTVVPTLPGSASTAGIDVTILSGSKRISKTIGSSGAVSLTLPYSPGSPVHVEMRQGSYFWTQEVKHIPQGVDNLKLYFTLDDAGVISFSRMEY